MTMPAARLLDMHLCTVPAPPPATPLPAPGIPNPISFPGAPNVMIGMMPAARVSDNAATGVPHPIVKGSGSVVVAGMPQARVMDTLACGGKIIPPCCPTVLVGG